FAKTNYPCLRGNSGLKVSECFSHGTATFSIMGDIHTRRCPCVN
ncbi:MAG: lipoate synthase, partial [Arenicella sp.]